VSGPNHEWNKCRRHQEKETRMSRKLEWKTESWSLM